MTDSTDYVVNSYIQTSDGDAYDLMGGDDTLLVTSAGSLVALGPADNGITAFDVGQTITLDGLAYSAEANGVELDGSFTSLFVNGQAQGEMAGVIANGSGDSVNIGGRGEVDSTYQAVDVVANSVTVTNDGHISGANTGVYIYTVSSPTVVNDGVISAASGSIEGIAISADGSSNAVIDNAGLISGPTAVYLFNGGSMTLDNSGTMQGTLDVTGTSSINVDNLGVWDASQLDFTGSSANTLTNSGRIDAAIVTGTGQDSIVNSGTITGAIAFGGGGNDDSLTNTGTIIGSIQFTDDTNDLLINGGTIHGAVFLGTNEVFINTGIVHGNLALGTGDSIDTSEGRITGAITATNSDLFAFHGSFGHNQIQDFVSTGTTHDTIDFGNDTFTSYSELQSHMAQVGANVVITLDPTDTIILTSTTLAHLVAHDFLFA